MPNKFKYLILILVILGILLPWPASAKFIAESTAIFKLILQGIAEKTMWMTFLMIGTIMVYIVGVVVLWLSLAFLPLFIQHQTLWMEALKPMTMSGWSFTVGLANMLLIIIFVVIAFAFIFRIESLQAKKALPRLLIIAFLINFSMLFVNMAIDISQILFETIIAAVERTHGSFSAFFGIIRNAIIAPLFASAVMLAVLIITLIVLFGIPYVNAIAQIVFTALFFPVIFPIIVFLWAQMAFFIPLAAMFLTLTILFAARVFILQILTILAPLAFISLILPQTKSFWNFWIKTLIEWLILGAVFLFLLVLGLSVLELLVPTISETIDPGLPQALSWLDWILKWAVILIVFYLALLVYLGATLYIGKKFIPRGAEGILGTVEGLTKTAIGATAGFASGKLRQKFASRRATQEARGQARKKEGALNLAARMETARDGGPPLGRRDKIKARNWKKPWKEKTSEEILDVASEAEAREMAAKGKAVRMERGAIKDLSPEEKVAEIYKEMRKPKIQRNDAKIEALAKEGDVYARNPNMIGRIESMINPKEFQRRLAEAMDDAMLKQHARDEIQKHPGLDQQAAELKVAAKALKDIEKQGKKQDPRGYEAALAKTRSMVYGEMTTDGMTKIRPRMLADNINHKNIDMNVLRGLSPEQAKQVAERSNEAVKQSFKNLIETNREELRSEFRKLRQEGKEAQAKRVAEKLGHIYHSV